VVMDRVGETEKRAIAQEVELLKNVQHKHILAFIDCFELESPSKPIVFITEYMSSGTLKQCACAARACTTSARGLADALLPAQVHQQGEARQAQGDQEVVPADARRAGLPAQVADHPPRPQVREHLHQRQHRRDQDRRPRPIDNDEGRRAASAERARCVAPRPTRRHPPDPPPPPPPPPPPSFTTERTRTHGYAPLPGPLDTSAPSATQALRSSWRQSCTTSSTTRRSTSMPSACASSRWSPASIRTPSARTPRRSTARSRRCRPPRCAAGRSTAPQAPGGLRCPHPPPAPRRRPPCPPSPTAEVQACRAR
jgi:hypothetical protein